MSGDGRRLEGALAAWEREPGERAAVEVTAGAAAFLDHAAAGDAGPGETALLHEFLERTSAPAFLEALPGAAERERWVDVSFAAIRRSRYTLHTLLAHRARTQGARALFEEYGRVSPARWTYAAVETRARNLAALFLAAGGGTPRVALYLENSVDGAACDLACLLHDIVVVPLSTHLSVEELAWILERLRISVAVTDAEERLQRLGEAGRRAGTPLRLFSLSRNRAVERGEADLLAAALAGQSPEEVDARLDARPRLGLDDPATVLFTSGSTGRPKGVVFTGMNLVAKRFARGAALPSVGRDETLLAYLPLFHTFGRYLEMLGMIYWRGTYVFAGNPSAETLLEGLRQVRPTGLVGIPLRWTQIRDRTLAVMEPARNPAEREAAFRSVVGDRLRWGLSAAGYLEPKVFQHFHRHGVELSSGFGMTEATGGITMSPPGDYRAQSVGRPLPGIQVQLTEAGEMRIAGPYVARYLSEAGSGLEREPALAGEWIATGDVFRELGDGHLTIVDRVKDIYKNDRGQTIAPQRVERKFHGVPGIRRTFLVGDHRSYNVLLIVPDPGDPVLRDAPDDESRREYFHQIVAHANDDLAPYERVVNFTLLDRDLDAAHGELTAKGSYRRKHIEENFRTVIGGLYERPLVEYAVDGLRVAVPRWFFRDLGVLETDIRAVAEGLHERRRGLTLRVARSPGGTRVRVGDLAYAVRGDVVDLGVFTRQPRLWLANPSLMRFAPCKGGWDVGLGAVSLTALLPSADRPQGPPERPRGIEDPALLHVNDLLQTALFGPVAEAEAALHRLARELPAQDERLQDVIRRRIPALAAHPDEEVRCLAYRILLLDEPAPGYGDTFPAFIESGLSFLNERSIASIAGARFEERRLSALRGRLARYRAELPWPAAETAREQFSHVLRLLVRFVHGHPEYYRPVRAELTSWTLHDADPALAVLARELLYDLAAWFEARLETSVPGTLPAEPDPRLWFDEEIPAPERERLVHLLSATSFLRESILLAFDEPGVDLDQVGPDGVWVSRLLGRGRFQLYRVSVNTVRRRHFDLLVIFRDDMDARAVMETNHWMLALGEPPVGERSLPRFGCARADLAAMSLEYVPGLTVADRIRELAGEDPAEAAGPRGYGWRTLFVRALAAILRAWDQSGRRIVPGAVDPANVVVAERDWQEDAVLLSLAGWEDYRDARSLFLPMWRTFYRKTAVLYPAAAGLLRTEWLWEACLDALGKEGAREFLASFLPFRGPDVDPALRASLEAWLAGGEGRYHPPLALDNAIRRYAEWSRMNAGATAEARCQALDQLMELYRLDRFGEPARYRLYRATAFAESPEAVRAAMDRLLDAFQADPGRSATERVELSELQAALVSDVERALFGHLVFPRGAGGPRLEVMAFGESERKQVTVVTHFTDARGESYDLREPVEPEEIGQLYRLFYQERFPKTVSERDRYLMVMDAAGRVVGGLCYKLESAELAHLDGAVVNRAVGGRGIATALLEDFATRMASRGIKVLRTNFFMRRFCEGRGYRLDRRWGGLVRFLDGGAATTRAPD